MQVRVAISEIIEKRIVASKDESGKRHYIIHKKHKDNGNGCFYGKIQMELQSPNCKEGSSKLRIYHTYLYIHGWVQ